MPTLQRLLACRVRVAVRWRFSTSVPCRPAGCGAWIARRGLLRASASPSRVRRKRRHRLCAPAREACGRAGLNHEEKLSAMEGHHVGFARAAVAIAPPSPSASDASQGRRAAIRCSVRRRHGSERLFREVPGEMRGIARPIPKGRAEAVDGGQAFRLHPAEQHLDRARRNWPVVKLAGKDKVAHLHRNHHVQDVDDGIGQRDTMFALGLHPRCRDRPYPLGQVDFAPARSYGFTRSAAVRMMNRNAIAETPGSAVNRCMKAGIS